MKRCNAVVGCMEERIGWLFERWKFCWRTSPLKAASESNWRQVDRPPDAPYEGSCRMRRWTVKRESAEIKERRKARSDHPCG